MKTCLGLLIVVIMTWFFFLLFLIRSGKCSGYLFHECGYNLEQKITRFIGDLAVNKMPHFNSSISPTLCS